MAFAMVLSYSPRIFLRFSLDARMDSFLRGHAEAFIAYGGVARVVLYDNLKSAVLERVGDAVRFNPELLAFAAHHCYEPRPVAIARGNEPRACVGTVTWASPADLSGTCSVKVLACPSTIVRPTSFPGSWP